jgi:hypothetical protein
LIKESATEEQRMKLTLRNLLWLALVGNLLCTIVAFGEPKGGLRPDWKPRAGGKKGDLHAPIFYRDVRNAVIKPMLVLANDKGAAAVLFTDDIREPGVTGVRYRYRYESFAGKTKQEGDGQLYEQRAENGTLGGNTQLVIADLSVGWSLGGVGTGWLYYSPEKTRVHLADGRTFNARAEPIPGRPGKFNPVPTLDLRRFKP